MSAIEARFRGDFGGFRLDVAFDVPARGVTALFGPSGCGKTTVLRCLAGLTRLADGYLSVDGAVWQDGRRFLAPHRRPVGYVFQEASLFPHLDGRRNLTFGMKKGGGGPGFDEVVDLLGLAPLLDRAPARLSGGERQRVAIGRALLSGPRLLLMDEPMAALDRFSKDGIIPYLETLHDSLSIPVVYVSHDLAEVERLADRMVLMQDGRVAAAGPLGELLTDSRLPVARSPEASTVVEGAVAGYDAGDDLSSLDIPGATLLVPGHIGEAGTRRRLRIMANDISLAVERPSKTTILNVLPARIRDVTPLEGGRVNVLCTAGPDESGARLLARITRRSLGTFGFRPGQDIWLQIKSVSMVDPHTGPKA